MAILHVKSPNGTTHTLDLETMNITHQYPTFDDPLAWGWCNLPNGLLFQFGTSQWQQWLPNYVGEIDVYGSYNLLFDETYRVMGVCTIGERDAGAIWITHYRSNYNGYIGKIYSATTFTSCSFNHILIGKPAS